MTLKNMRIIIKQADALRDQIFYERDANGNKVDRNLSAQDKNRLLRIYNIEKRYKENISKYRNKSKWDLDDYDMTAKIRRNVYMGNIPGSKTTAAMGLVNG